MHSAAQRRVLLFALLALGVLAQAPAPQQQGQQPAAPQQPQQQPNAPAQPQQAQQQQQQQQQQQTDTAFPTLGSSSSSSQSQSQSSSSSDDSNTSAFPTLTSVSTSAATPTSAFPTHSALVPPKLVVPDTENAPYMHTSTLPEGTVFISVGAVLAVLGAAVVAWRLAVAYSLRRSLSRVANSAYDGKGGLFPFSDSKGQYTSLDPGSVSLEHLSAVDTSYGNGGVRDRTSKGKRESSKPPPSASLFFSPTGAGMAPPSKSAASSHLPSGYYAQGGSTINSGDLFAQLGGNNRNSPGTSTGGAQDGRSSGPSTATQYQSGSREQRRSAAASSHGRAPSAYLEGGMDNSRGRGPRQ